MSDTGCGKCGDPKGSCSTSSSKGQNGKGDAPRNMSKTFRSNYDGINWGASSSKKKKAPAKSSRR